MPILLLIFIGVPLIEIAVFIEVGGWLGLWPTLAVVILTAVVGTALLRHQGLSTLRRAQAAMDRSELPLKEVFDGLCLLVAGALLLTPGFVTDAVGGLLFVPAVRTLLRRWLGRHLLSRAEVHVVHPDGTRGPVRGAGDVIDGEYEDLTPSDDDGPPGDGRDGRLPPG